eukprot:EG_transcript_6526
MRVSGNDEARRKVEHQGSMKLGLGTVTQEDATGWEIQLWPPRRATTKRGEAGQAGRTPRRVSRFIWVCKAGFRHGGNWGQKIAEYCRNRGGIVGKMVSEGRRQEQHWGAINMLGSQTHSTPGRRRKRLRKAIAVCGSRRLEAWEGGHTQQGCKASPMVGSHHRPGSGIGRTEVRGRLEQGEFVSYGVRTRAGYALLRCWYQRRDSVHISALWAMGIWGRRGEASLWHAAGHSVPAAQGIEASKGGPGRHERDVAARGIGCPGSGCSTASHYVFSWMEEGERPGYVTTMKSGCRRGGGNAAASSCVGPRQIRSGSHGGREGAAE